MKKLDILCLLGMVFSSAQLVHAADCATLKDLKLADTTITTAEPTSGDFAAPGGQPTLHALPPFCRVTGILHPSADSKIRFEIWQPEKDWNQRFLGVGNGGFAGSIGYQELGGNLRRGFATAGSDAGHQGEAEDTFRAERLVISSLDGDRKTDAFYYGGIRPTIRLTLADGRTIEGTPNHRIKVANAQGYDWKRLDEIDEHDCVAVRFGAEIWAKEDAAIEFQPTPLYGCQKTLRIPERMSPDLGRFLGYVHPKLKWRTERLAQVAVTTAEVDG